MSREKLYLNETKSFVNQVDGALVVDMSKSFDAPLDVLNTVDELLHDIFVQELGAKVGYGGAGNGIHSQADVSRCVNTNLQEGLSVRL